MGASRSAARVAALPLLLAVAAVALLLFPATLVHCAAAPDMKTYLVHVTENLLTVTERRSWHLALIANATGITSASDLEQRLLYSYNLAFHGFSALLSSSEASSMHALEDVVALSEASLSKLHTTRTPSFLDLSTSVISNDASGELWRRSSRGQDVIIAVIDSGAWPEHPSFSDAGLSPIPATWNGSCHPSFPCNNKIIGARFFSAGYVAAIGRPINESLEFNSPRDSDGHGTHTASTAAGSVVPVASFRGLASGAASGISPLSRISIYKACWIPGCYDVDIIAAFEAAISDGVHVISVSVGGDANTDYANDGIALGSFAAVARGITVVCSAGNAGPGLGTVTNGPPWILTVAASSLDRDFPAPVTLGNGSVYVGSSLYVGMGISRIPELKPLIHAKDAAVVGGDVDKASLCLDSSFLDPAVVNGKILLCEEGNVSSVAKGQAVAEAGGVGTIVANFVGSGEELSAAAFVTPGAIVGYNEGEAIKQYIGITGSTPTARIDFNGTRLGVRAPAMTAFSSRGPHLTSMGIAKPDITAPGLNILAAWPSLTNNSFYIISGTSMSCPHVAGLAALLKGAYPTWSPAAIRSALMTTATVTDNEGLRIVDLATSGPANLLSFGSGHVVPNSALDPGLVYDTQPQAYVDFLCALDPSGSLVRIYGTSSTSCSTPIPSIGDLNYPSFAVLFLQGTDPSAVFTTMLQRTVTNVGSPQSVYTVSITPPPSVNVSVSPSTLSFDAQTKILTYSINFSAPRLSSSVAVVAFGSLSWSDAANHLVRSPISFFWIP